MRTIIQTLQDGFKATDNINLQDKIDEMKEDLQTANDENQDLQGQLEESISEDDCNVYNTALGKILVRNVTGNLWLQQEIEDFFELLKSKYN